MSETVLVVGGAGYIGSVNLAALIEWRKRVIVLDNFENGHREAVHPEDVIEECDIRDNESVKRVFARHTINCVLHFGAYAYVGESMTKADEYFVNNVIGGHHSLNAMRNHPNGYKSR